MTASMLCHNNSNVCQPTSEKCSYQQQWFFVQQDEGVVEEQNKRFIMNSYQHIDLFAGELVLDFN